MATKMSMADLKLVDANHPNAQRVAVLDAPGTIRMGHAEIPEPTHGEVRVRVKWVGVCGSDLEAFRGTRSPEFISTPARLGHEVAGVIDKVGPGVLGLTPGMRVTCRYVWGAFAEYIVCRPINVKVVPDDLPMEAVSLIEILPGVIHAAELGKIDGTKSVLVMGQGVSGLILTQVLALYSPKALAVTDLKPKNLELARRYGATHTYQLPHGEASTLEAVEADFPDGFDVVVPCLLEGDGMVDAIEVSATGARIVMYGCIGVCRKPLDFFKVHRKRLAIYATEPRRDIDMRHFFEEGIGMVRDGLVHTAELITDFVPLSEVERAFALRDAQGTETIHVLVDCEK